MREELGIESALIRGTDGVFDVVADGSLMFSKHDAGRFPSHAEIIAALRNA